MTTDKAADKGKKQKGELMSQRQFARCMNMSPSYINKLIKQGKIPVHEGRQVAYEEAVRAMESVKEHTRESQRQHAEKLRKKKKGGIVEIEDFGIKIDLNDIDFGDLDLKSIEEIGQKTQRAKLITEALKGALLKLQAEKEKGNLISIQDVKDINDKVASAIRAKMLTLPVKVAAKLEGLTAAEIKHELENEINEVLSELNRLEYKGKGKSA